MVLCQASLALVRLPLGGVTVPTWIFGTTLTKYVNHWDAYYTWYSISMCTVGAVMLQRGTLYLSLSICCSIRTT